MKPTICLKMGNVEVLSQELEVQEIPRKEYLQKQFDMINENLSPDCPLSARERITNIFNAKISNSNGDTVLNFEDDDVISFLQGLKGLKMSVTIGQQTKDVGTLFLEPIQDLEIQNLLQGLHLLLNDSI